MTTAAAAIELTGNSFLTVVVVAVIAVLAACTPENQKDASRILVFPVDRFGAKPTKETP